MIFLEEIGTEAVAGWLLGIGDVLILGGTRMYDVGNPPHSSVVVVDGDMNLLGTIIVLEDGTRLLYDKTYNGQIIDSEDSVDDVVDDLTKDCTRFTILSMLND